MDALLKIQNIAVIDLGTNTFNLLIIKKTTSGYNEVYSEKVGVGLGLGGITKNIIVNNAILRGIDTLKHYKSICDKYHVSEIFAFGTSAIRNATNKEDFLAQVANHTGIIIHVISGEIEANYIFAGVLSGLPKLNNYLIMDIGGGSTEFIHANYSKIKAAQSFEIGVARIFQNMQFADPFTEKDCQKIEDYLEKKVGSFFDAVTVSVLVGASGSFETLYELIHNTEYPNGKYSTFSKTEIQKELDSIIQSTFAEREKNKHIIPIRKKMIPIAAVKIRWIIRKLNIQKIIISPYSLKEGIIAEVIN